MHLGDVLGLISVVLLVIYPAVFIQWIPQIHSFRPASFALSALLSLLVAFSIAGVLSRFGGRSRRWVLGLTASMLLCLFGWRFFIQIGDRMGAAFNSEVLSATVAVLAAALFLWLSWRLAQSPLFAILILVVSVLIVWGPVVGLLHRSTESATARPPAIESRVSAHPPDILILILDGYARQDVLKEDFGFDNRTFLDDLDEMGYFVPDVATANYSMTFASLSGILAMDYHINPGALADADYALARELMSGQNPLFAGVKGAGYEIRYLENGWQGSRCGSVVDSCMRNGVLGQTVFSLSELTIFAPVTESLIAHPFGAQGLAQLEALERDLPTSANPTLTFAHVTLPHPPLLLNEQCLLINSSERRGLYLVDPGASPESIEARRRAYVEQVQCVNNLVLQVLEAFTSAHNNGVVMVTADHGTDSRLQLKLDPSQWSKDAVWERMSVFSAYLVPEACQSRLYPSITPINGIRMLYGCAIGVDIPAVADRNFLVTSEDVNPGEVVEILIP